ncbi:hypothetical protein I4U23_023953 [Adineta vaga]|nr:hypothetical protein I4U23_023953 [Adineta vaga]
MMKVLISVLVMIQTINSLELKKSSSCQTALGMQSGSIPDSAISASSSYDINTVGPKASRARTEQYGGAWCPLHKVASIPNEWLEINFDNLTYLTQVETQGRFNNGQGKEYADYYILMYTRLDNLKHDEIVWIEYKPNNERQNSTWIRANQNTYIGEIRQLDPPIVAKRLRFYPVSKQSRTICMRVEVYGCLFSDGIVSYSMPQGRTDVNSFGDDTYDGKYLPSKNILINGLGQLSDGITGTEEITVRDGRQPWIGWSNQTNGFIRIEFQFDTIRQINRVTIHTNNLFSKQILIFKTAIVSFSIDNEEKNYSHSVIYQHNRDDIFEIARPILIELNNQIGKFVRLDLYFDSKWLLISEVTFDSQIYNPKTEKKTEIKDKTLRKTLTMGKEIRKQHVNTQQLISTTTIMTSINAKLNIPTILTVELYLAFLIGALIAIGILLFVSLIWIIRRKKKLRFQKLTEKPGSNSSCYTYPTLPVREFYDLNVPITNTNDDRDYAVPDVNFYSTFSPAHHVYSPHLIRTSTANTNPYPTLKPISYCCLHHPHQQEHPYATMCQQISPPTIQDISSIEATCGNSLMIKLNPNVQNQQMSMKEINNDQLVFIEKIGDGSFGSLHIAEMNVDNAIEKETVIVKLLNDNIGDQTKTLFWNEIESISTLKNPNVCSILGISTSQQTMAIFEYYSLDLYQYLRQQSIPLDNCSAASFLLSLACQIAAGMKYLSSFHIVHRDLATRNCLISPINHQLHLTDIAMAKSEYSNDYARIGSLQSRIPLRWIAPEYLFSNEFSLKSDIWSFGVTLYELFTYARQRPYHSLTNEQLVQQLATLSQIQMTSSLMTKDFHLPKPELCSKEIYDMMCECWQPDALRRPSFADIYIFLISRASGSSSLLILPGL